MAAGSKAGSWLFSAKEKTEHSLVVPMFWSFLCAPMPAAETKPRSQLASAVFKSFWGTSRVFFCCDLVTFCLWLCRLGGLCVACVWLHLKAELRLFCPFTWSGANTELAAKCWDGWVLVVHYFSFDLLVCTSRTKITILWTKSCIWCTGCEGFKLLELLCLSVQPTQTPRDTLVQSLNLLSSVKSHFPGLNRSWTGTCCHHELLYWSLNPDCCSCPSAADCSEESCSPWAFSTKNCIKKPQTQPWTDSF